MSNCSGLYLASKARAGAGESAPPPTASSRAIVPLSLSLPASQFIASEQLCWASSAEEAAWRPETAAARLLKEAGGAVTGAMLEKEIATTVSHALRNWQPEPAPRVVDVTITYSQGGVPVVDTFQWCAPCAVRHELFLN